MLQIRASYTSPLFAPLVAYRRLADAAVGSRELFSGQDSAAPSFLWRRDWLHAKLVASQSSRVIINSQSAHAVGSARAFVSIALHRLSGSASRNRGK